MKRLIGSTTLALVALALIIGPAAAGRQWCAKDPIVSLNGTTVQILVAVPMEYVPAVDGPVEVRIAAPDGVAHEIVFLDAGFNGHGETVRFQTTGGVVAADGSFDVRIRVEVPVDRHMLRAAGLPGEVPLQVTVITNGTTTVVEDFNRAKVDLTVQGSN